MRGIVCGLVIVVASAGCEDSDVIRIETAPVTGVATYQGKPLEDYRVYFYIPDHAAKEPATGRVDAEGKFSLTVRSPGDGAIIGKNKVWLKFDPPMPEQEPGKEKPFILPPAKVKVPEKYLKMDTSGIEVDVPADGLPDFKLELQ